MNNRTIEQSITPTEIELLAPARNAATAIVAIDHGADAVYMGPPSHGARKLAANSLDDIRLVVSYAHKFNVKVYVTVNTVVYDDELNAVEQLVWDLYAIGVDALIVQDLSLLKMHLPPIALHASTQCDIRTPQKARFLQDAGFSQLVLPRELSIDEIRDFRHATSVPLEVFVHGALCVSYSGDCQASYVLTSRSANRGECAQICRYAFDLEDAQGNKLVQNRHLLSLRDMNRIDSLAQLLDAGVSSLKIEGRLKDENYVKNVLAAYNLALNRIIAMNPDRYCRASHGVVDYTFSPDLSNSFNRGYTDYFLNNRQPAKGSLASFATPKWVGREVATVRRQLSNRLLLADVKMPLANGDGLGFFDAAGKFCGFRLNRVERDKLHTATDVSIPSGTTIYRNFDKQWNDDMDRTTAHRKLPVDMHLAWNAEKNALILAMSLTSSDYVASASVACECVPAKVPQSDNRKRVLSKLGDTIFTLNALIDDVVECFVPASVLTSLRREAVDALLLTIEATYKFQRRQPNVLKSDALADKVVTRHDNIANHLAEQVYREAGVSCNKMPMAIEVAKPVERELRVMQSRYCIRREMGACLKTAGAKSLPSPLFITSGSSRFRLDFECGKCQMNVIALR